MKKPSPPAGRKPTAVNAAAATWLATRHARCLVEVPIAPDRFEQAMENRLRDAFEAGFAVGIEAGAKGRRT